MDTVERRHRGIYLLPNLFTTAALFAGFYSIVAAMNDQFGSAAIAIFIAMVLDGLDGRVARMTNTQSEFGAQYDSLSDVISFGLAPALVMYEWSLSSLGKFGWLAAFVYTAGAALRLARFNVQLAVADKRFFTGLASPAAAAVVAGMVWVGFDKGIDGRTIHWITFALTAGAGLLMVSNFRYYSFKDLDVRGRVPFFALLIIVLIFVVVSTDPPIVLFASFVIYALSGPITTIMLLRRKRRAKAAGEEPQTIRDQEDERRD